MTVDKTAAIILAAGYSSRMGALKAMLPLRTDTVIDHSIRVLKDAGCDPIVVVTGHQGDVITKHIKDSGVIVQHNPDYDNGMFSSVLAGVRALVPYRPTGFFVLPVDHVFLSPALLQHIIASHKETKASVTYPMFGGAKGHPPLISHDCIPSILLYQGNQGLKGALLPFDNEAMYVICEDQGILMDMDTKEAYERNLKILAGDFLPQQLFLQGDLHIGKSTMLAALLKDKLPNVGGFYVQRAISGGRCVGFCLRSVKQDGLKEKKVCPLEQQFLTRAGEEWQFHPQVFDGWAAELLRKEMDAKPALMLLDEIGGLELSCPVFAKALYQLLDSDIPLIGVYKQQKNAKAQQASVATGPDYNQNRRKLVKTLVKGSGSFLTLRDDNREEVQGKVEAFLCHHLPGKEAQA